MLVEQPLSSSIYPVTLLSPQADLFAARAARLRHLAAGHPLAAWLNWLAELATAQHAALAAMPDLGLRFAGDFDPTRLLLATDLPALQEQWPQVAADLATALGVADFASAPIERRAHQALQIAAGEQAAAGRDITDAIVAAALQVVWTAAARQLALPERIALGDLPTCPCCGSAPVGAIVMAGAGMSGLRYLECCLCATRWNAVRARCTLCDVAGVVSYWGIDGGNAAIKAESCDQCHGYIKTYFQNQDAAVDLVADDLASLALDVLVGEQAYARGAPNLFLGDGEAV